jgi:hypothetical protein
MRTQLLSSGKIAGGLLASAVLAMSFSSVSFAGTSIYGTPSTSVVATRYYGFQSWASDTDHKSLSYTIKNKPSWATFDARYGHLYGVPTAANVGTYSNILITASDGVSSASLKAFSITVKPNGSTTTTGGGGTGTGSGGGTSTTGSATVTWTPPTLNTNGSALTNLAGYTINYGTSSSNLSTEVKVSSTGVTSYVIDNLPAGTYYFGVTAYSSSGQTSSVSNVVSKTIQ